MTSGRALSRCCPWLESLFSCYLRLGFSKIFCKSLQTLFYTGYLLLCSPLIANGCILVCADKNTIPCTAKYAYVSVEVWNRIRTGPATCGSRQRANWHDYLRHIRCFTVLSAYLENIDSEGRIDYFLSLRRLEHDSTCTSLSPAYFTLYVTFTLPFIYLYLGLNLPLLCA